MNMITKTIKWVMLASGLLTCTMLYAAIAPEAALMSIFGASISGPVAEIVVRNWGILITLMGAMLIYGAFSPPYRTFIITIVTISKVAFISLVLGFGSQYLSNAWIDISLDAIVVVIFILYLMGQREKDD